MRSFLFSTERGQTQMNESLFVDGWSGYNVIILRSFLFGRERGQTQMNESLFVERWSG